MWTQPDLNKQKVEKSIVERYWDEVPAFIADEIKAKVDSEITPSAKKFFNKMMRK